MKILLRTARLTILATSLGSPFGLLGESTAAAQNQPARESTVLANAPLEASELAEFLGISSWAFAYEGGPPRCWLEIVEDGQKTISRPRVLEVKEANSSKEAGRGKILLFLRRGNIELRLNSGASSGGAGITLPETALWWGWKGSQGSSLRLVRPLTPKLGQEVTLLSYTMEEVRMNEPDAKPATREARPPRKVQLVLKARLGD